MINYSEEEIQRSLAVVSGIKPVIMECYRNAGALDLHLSPEEKADIDHRYRDMQRRDVIDCTLRDLFERHNIACPVVYKTCGKQCVYAFLSCANSSIPPFPKEMVTFVTDAAKLLKIPVN